MSTCKEKSNANFLIFLTWLVYTTSYLGKVSYSANISQIIDFYNVSRSEAGLVPTFFFFAYGIGQFINGAFCRKYNIKWMIFLSLFFSGIINFILSVSTDFQFIKWLWMLNGALMSVLWPTLIRLLSESLPQRYLGKSSVVMGTTVATGTLIIYALSALYAVFGAFKLAFFTAAISEITVALIWLFSYKSATAQEGQSNASIAPHAFDEKPKSQQRGSAALWGTLGVLCLCAVGVNLIKDGLTTWVPTILKETGAMPDSLSILLTLFLPLLAIVGNAFALLIHKKIPDYVKHCMAVFFVAMLIIGAVIGGLTISSVALMLVGMIIVNFLVSSLNSIVTGIFPLYMREHMNSGRCAGVLNGFCYLGSSLSSFGLGAIADSYGWSTVFWCLFAVCAVIVAVCGIYSLFAGRIRN